MYFDNESKLDGRPAAAIELRQRPGSNAREVIRDVKQRLEALKHAAFLPGMDYELSCDVSRFLDASVHEVVKTLLEAFFLVTIVVFVFLQDVRATLVPIAAVPVSLVSALIFTKQLDFSLNMITLFALVLSIGIVVDNAIVVVEAVHYKITHEHLSPREASERAIRELGPAIIAITLVMVAVFVPLAFIPGPAGVFYKQFGLTTAIAITLSGVVALTFAPALCAILMRPHTPLRIFNGFNRGYARFENGYAGIARPLASRLVVPALLIAGFTIGGLLFAKKVPQGFIPNEDQGIFYVAVSTPPGATLLCTREVVDEVSAIARTLDGVESVATLAGNNVLTDGTGARYGTLLVNLTAWEHRTRKAADIMAELAAKTRNVQDAKIEMLEPPPVPGYGDAGGVQLSVLDKSGRDDPQEMARVVTQFVADLRQRPEIGDATTVFEVGFPQLAVDIDIDRAAQLGVTPQRALDTLQTLLGGEYATNFIRFGQMYKVMGRGASRRPREAGASALAARAQRSRRVGADVGVHPPREEVRPRYADPLQHVPVGGGHRPARARHEQRRHAARGPGDRRREAAARLRHRLRRCREGRSERREPGPDRRLDRAALRVARARRAVRELRAAGGGPAVAAARAVRRVRGAALGWPREQCLYAPLARRADRPARQERDPDRRVRRASARGRPQRARCRRRGRTAAAAADPDDLARVHRRSRAALDRERRRRDLEPHDRRRDDRRDGRGHGVGPVDRAGPLRRVPPAAEEGAMKRALLVLLASCAPALPDVHVRAVALPASYDATAAGRSIASIDWATFFADDHLRALIGDALRGNYDLQLALAAGAGVRKYARYTVDGAGNVGTEIAPSRPVPSVVPDLYVGLQASWEPDLWRRLGSAEGAARLRYLASVEGHHFVVTNLVADVATAYYALVALDETAAVLNQTIEHQAQALEMMRIQKEAGRTNQLAVSQFEAQLAGTRALAAHVTAETRELELQIAYLLGRAPAPIARSADALAQPLPPLAAGVPSELLRARPDVRQAELEVEAARLDVRAARAAFYPRLRISADLGYDAFDPRFLLRTPASLAYSLAGGIVAPLVNRRGIAAAFRTATAMQVSAMVTYQATVLRSFVDAASALSTAQRAADSVVQQQEKQDALADTVEAATELFRAGQATYVDVLLAQQQTLQAQLELIAARRDQQIAKVRLYRALGGGWR
jgi:NodT family efflux transporter outer membrane factor (OMF) lipoprotein